MKEDCNIHEFLNDFHPYFASLRRIDSFLIIDAEVPTNWDVGKLTQDLAEGSKSIQTLLTGQDKDSSTKVISIVGWSEFHNYNTLFARFEKIIKVNREREEKNKLFKVMVKKLEKVFIDSDLDKLQNLKIDIPENGESIDDVEVGHSDNVELRASEQKMSETLDSQEIVNKNNSPQNPQ